MTRRALFRIRAMYPATSVMLIVWGDDFDEAERRARYYQKGALAYCFVEELAADDMRGYAAI